MIFFSPSVFFFSPSEHFIVYLFKYVGLSVSRSRPFRCTQFKWLIFEMACSWSASIGRRYLLKLRVLIVLPGIEWMHGKAANPFLLVRHSMPKWSVGSRLCVELVLPSVSSKSTRAESIFQHVLFESIFPFSPRTRIVARIVYFQRIHIAVWRSSCRMCSCVKRETRDRINCACEKYDRQRAVSTDEGRENPKNMGVSYSCANVSETRRLDDGFEYIFYVGEFYWWMRIRISNTICDIRFYTFPHTRVHNVHTLRWSAVLLFAIRMTTRGPDIFRQFVYIPMRKKSTWSQHH